jgi:type I restriction enzyme S subunit
MSDRKSVHHYFVDRFGVPEGWTEVRLREVADIVGGGTPDSAEPRFWDGDIPWLTPTEMTALRGRFATTSERKITRLAVDSSNCRLLPPGSLVLSTRGTIGNIVIAGVSLTCNQSCEALLPRDGVDSEYLYYLLVYLRPLLERFGAGTTFSSVTRRDIRDIRLSLPLPAEQHAIAAILVRVDEVLAAAEAKLMAARQLKTALMQQFFTRGIPGRHTRFKHTKVGEIPESWELLPLGKLASIVSGIALNTDRAPKFNPHQYLTVVHVQRERLDLAEVRHLEVFSSELPDALLAEGDILVVEGHANSAEIGRAAIATREVAGFTYQNHLFRIRLLQDAQLDRLFLLGVLNSERVRRHWASTCNTSSGLNTINRRLLRKLLVQRPNTREQEEISALLSSANNTIAGCEAEVLAVERLKHSLLQNLLTGRVRVRA